MNPKDARDLSLQEGDSIRIFSRGADVSMTLKLSGSVPEKMVFCPAYDRSTAALIPLSPDRASSSSCWVRIEKEK
jgi:predicted molibdopterin-dependent oxidoreductase YjgC